MSSENLETRERILQAAWQLLEADGGRSGGKAVRMSDIAKAAGISRQAVYLHFPTRAELLIATTRHIDRVKDSDSLLAPSRAAPDGLTRLDAFVDAWGRYMPEIYPVAKALLAMRESDEAAAAAWCDRMRALHEGCRAAVAALARDGRLTQAFSEEEAGDLLWAQLSVYGWEQLTQERGWSVEAYCTAMKRQARAYLVED